MRSTSFFFVVAAVAMSVSAVACRPPATPPKANSQTGTAPTGSASAAVAGNEQAPEPATIELLAPGTKIDPKALPERTRLVFRSKPKLSSGDVAKVGKSIREALESFTTLVVVEAEPDPAKPGMFRRGPFKLGIGHPGDTGDVVITKDTAKEHGVKLGLFERKILAEREKELATVRSPGASPTMAMFDFSMVFVRDGKRVPITVRYMSLVDPKTGNTDTAYWVLDSGPDSGPDGLRFHGDSLWVLPPNHLMDWEMDVDGNEITFGAPNSDTFASTKLPQGTEHRFPTDLKTSAAAKAFTAEAGAHLEQQVRNALKDAK